MTKNEIWINKSGYIRTTASCDPREKNRTRVTPKEKEKAHTHIIPGQKEIM